MYTDNGKWVSLAEAFVKTFKRDYVALGDLSSAAAVAKQLPAWFEDYNQNAPHINALFYAIICFFLQIVSSHKMSKLGWGGLQISTATPVLAEPAPKKTQR